MLSFMASEMFEQSPVLILPLVALGLFGAVFLGVLVRTLGASKHAFDSLARMPLEEPERLSDTQTDTDTPTDIKEEAHHG